MPNKRPDPNSHDPGGRDSSMDELLRTALERGDDNLETGRQIVTFKENATDEGLQALGAQGMRVADVREFEGQAARLDQLGDADAVVFPEIGVALIEAGAATERRMGLNSDIAGDSPIESIDPEYFVFPEGTILDDLRASLSPLGNGGPTDAAPLPSPRFDTSTLVEPPRHGAGPQVELPPADFMRGFFGAVDALRAGSRSVPTPELIDEAEVQVLGATWGLVACRVPPSVRSGIGIRVAVLDTGMDLGHPDFVGRPIVGATFVGQPVQDLNGHGTHCIGTACGPRTPAGSTPRYGIGYKAGIFAGKVLRNDGWSVGGSVLNGMNWAIAQRCPVISLSLGSQAPVQPYYTAAGQAALSRGLLMIAAAGNAGAATGAPANSPTIMAVASLDRNLQPSSYSNRGKIEIAAPGRDVFSAWPRPRRYNTISGTSMAAPHVAGCAALWAETSTALRGVNLWRRLLATARPLPHPASRVGRGLVQAP